MNFKLNLTSLLQKSLFLMFLVFLLSGCKGVPGADARKYPDDPKLRVKKKYARGSWF